MLLEGGKPGNNPFAAMMGGAAEEAKDEFGRPKTYRHYALGAVLSGGSATVRAAACGARDAQAPCARHARRVPPPNPPP